MRLTLGIRAHRDMHATRVIKKPSRNLSKKVEGGWRQGFRWYERAGKRHECTQAVGLKEWWAGLHSVERESEFRAAGRRAGLPNELYPEFESAESMAVPNSS